MSRLGSSHHIDELLARIRTSLGVDTVAMLLVDPAGTHLVATAATEGLEQEVRQGVRVPIGRGFAGRVAETRAPVLLETVGPTTVVNPILQRVGIRSMLGVPMIANGTLLGVLHVGTLEVRQFSDDDTTALERAAGRVATAVLARKTEAELTAARTLQQSLMPTRLPEVDGLEFASRFVAAEAFGVGGDWIDAFTLPNGDIGIAVGDVAGSGLSAAVVMGRLRSALRAYAIESSSPAHALTRLNRKFTHFEPSEMATVLYITVAADLQSFTLSSAGHLPPVVAEPGRAATLLECLPSPPIGSGIVGDPVDVVSALRPGMVVACYTDGLIERRTESISEGLRRLCEATVAGPADEVCASMMTSLIGSTTVEDDTALLVFRRTK